jgi:hypothetical protein
VQNRTVKATITPPDNIRPFFFRAITQRPFL